MISWASKLLLIWLAGAVVSDVIHGSTFLNAARGWALIFFTFSNLLGLWVLTHGKVNRVIWAYIGLVASGVLGFFLEPNIYARSIPWKFGFAYPLTLGVALLACSLAVRRRAGTSAIILGIMGIVNLVLGARSLAMITVIAAVFTLMAQQQRVRLRGNGTLITIIALAFIVVYFLTFTYGQLASSGQLGLAAQKKYLTQSAGQLGLLIGGRQESAFSIPAVIESPIIGHGSFAPITHDLLSQGVGFLRANGYLINSLPVEMSGTIPTHSALLQAWVAHGIAGAIFWFWVLFICFSGVAYALRHPHPLSPLSFFVGTSLVWDTLLSPYGSQTRLIIPLAIILLTLRHTEKSGFTL
jgi:hypothetical protein